MLPVTLGAHDVTVYGLVALKLNISVRAYVVLPLMIELNVPTAYIVPPHWTSWRICWVVLDVAGRCGVFVAGNADTTPTGGCSPPVPACAAGAPSVTMAAAAANGITYLRTAASFNWQ